MSTSDNTNEVQPELPDTSCRRFLLAEVQLATNDFHDSLLLGSGGFGKVYMGLIDDGATKVAVKRLNPDSNQGSQEFWTEVKTLSDLRHTHLVALVGYCDDLEELILIYEFIPNGTLADHLYKIDGDQDTLTWEQRLEICIGAARGLDYLHTGTVSNQGGFIHRDVKTTNILLDQNWVAKVSDFGLSKAVTSYSQTHMSTAVKGTFGYLDPDYYITRRITKKSDVYAFGVVMLEVLSGKPAVDIRREEDQISLVFWAKHCVGHGSLYNLVDPAMKHVAPESLKRFLKVAIECLHDRPQGRPTMAEVVAALEQVSSSDSSKKGKKVEPAGQLPPKKKKGLSWLKRLETSIEKSFRDSLPKSIENFQNSLPRSVEFQIAMPWASLPPPNDNLSNGEPDGKRNASCSQKMMFNVRRT